MNVELTDEVAKKFMSDLGMPLPRGKIKRINFLFESGQAFINVDEKRESDQMNALIGVDNDRYKYLS